MLNGRLASEVAGSNLFLLGFRRRDEVLDERRFRVFPDNRDFRGWPRRLQDPLGRGQVPRELFLNILYFLFLVYTYFIISY